jgi:phosphonate transport system substrate-binding protein
LDTGTLFEETGAPLKLITYLAPSIPAEFFRLIADDLGSSLEFNETISGPLPGDDEPFTSGRADIGFVCSPTYRWLRNSVELLPLPVPVDPRAAGRPVYFADVVVRSDASYDSLDQLRGWTWGFNDRNSRSGWFAMLERCGPQFFRSTVVTGSHLRSIEMVEAGEVTAASIDSNVLQRQPHPELRVIESWGPFGIQPVIVRKGLDASKKREIALRLLTLHQRHDLRPYGFLRFTAPDATLYAV